MAPGFLAGRDASRSSMGSAKAAVLPVPVWAQPQQVLALQHRGDGPRLDGRGLLIARLGHGPQHGPG